jgi:hypothetical protein
MGHREELIQRSIPFLQEVKDMTPSAAMEKWLNEKYGEGSDLYEDLARLIKLGVEEGWAGSRHYPEVKGGRPYRVVLSSRRTDLVRFQSSVLGIGV